MKRLGSILGRWGGLALGLQLLAAAPAAAYPDSLKFDLTLTATPNQLDLIPGDRFLIQRSAGGGLLRLIDTLGFTQKTTISAGGSPPGGCLNAAGTAYYATLGNGTLLTVNVSDPLNIPATTTTTIASGVAFTTVRCFSQNNVDYLHLWDSTNNRITVYNASDQKLINSDASTSSIALDANVVDYRIPATVNLLLVFRKNGMVSVYDPVGLYQVGSTLDLKTVFPNATNLVAGYGTSVTNFGYLGVVLNASNPGELYLLNLNNLLTSGLLIVSADSSYSTAQPAIVSAYPAAAGFGRVLKPISGASEADYGAVINQSGKLEWLDFSDWVSNGKLAPKASLTAAASVPVDGVVFSSKGDNYLYLADTANTRLRVATSNPLLTITSPPNPATISTAQAVTFSFKSDLAGHYNVQLNGYTAKSSAIVVTEGREIQQGDMLADTPVTVTVPAGTAWVEGTNYLTTFVNHYGLIGRTRVSVDYIPPPKPVSGFHLQFGNQKIFIHWRSLASSYTDHYNIYFGTGPSDFSGLPDFSQSSPIAVAHTESEKSMTYILTPVANGTEVFVQISAVNKAGAEGPRSEVKSEIAEETTGILERFHETGGCGTAPSGAGGGLLVAALGGLLLRRRAARWFLAAFWVAVAAAPNAAAAAPGKTFSTEIFYNFWLPYNHNTDDFFGGWGNALPSVRFGYFPVADLNLGLETGFLYKTAPMVGVSSGRPSGESINLFYLPILYSVQYRLAFLPPKFFTTALEAAFGMNYFHIKQSTGKESGLKYTIRPAGTLYLRLEGLTRDIDQLNQDLGVSSLYFTVRLAYQHQFSSGVDLSAFEFGTGLGAEF